MTLPKKKTKKSSASDSTLDAASTYSVEGETIFGQSYFPGDGEKSPGASNEEFTYQVDKIMFIVTPVYKKESETIQDILLKLMLAELGPA